MGGIGKQQIPCEDDNQKGKGNGQKGKGNGQKGKGNSERCGERVKTMILLDLGRWGR